MIEKLRVFAKGTGDEVVAASRLPYAFVAKFGNQTIKQ